MSPSPGLWHATEQLPRPLRSGGALGDAPGPPETLLPHWDRGERRDPPGPNSRWGKGLELTPALGLGRARGGPPILLPTVRLWGPSPSSSPLESSVLEARGCGGRAGPPGSAWGHGAREGMARDGGSGGQPGQSRGSPEPQPPPSSGSSSRDLRVLLRGPASRPPPGSPEVTLPPLLSSVRKEREHLGPPGSGGRDRSQHPARTGGLDQPPQYPPWPRGHPGDLTLHGGPAPGALWVPQHLQAQAVALLQRQVDSSFPILRGGDIAVTTARATMG